MKSARLPSRNIDPELRAAVESVLKEGEALSTFIRDAVRAQIEYRRTRDELIARGFAPFTDHSLPSAD